MGSNPIPAITDAPSCKKMVQPTSGLNEGVLLESFYREKFSLLIGHMISQRFGEHAAPAEGYLK